MQRLGTAISVAAFLILVSLPAPASAQVVLDCDYFNFQEQAQAIFEEDESDPNFLDEDEDGIACPDLPSAGLEPEFPELPASGEYRCVDFPYQEMAQEEYDFDPSDPYNLDPTGDGIACSRLPLLADYQVDEGLTDEEALLEEEALTDEALADEELAGEVIEEDPEADAAAADETDAASGTLTEAEREERRAARRAARQAEREAAAEESGEAPADE